MRRRALVEHGDRSARTSPLWPDWRANLHPSLRPLAKQRVASGELPLHGYAHALNSSQAFAMNLFLPVAGGAPSAFAAWVGRAVGLHVAIESVDLEYYGSGDLLCEIPGPEPGPHDKLTAADVAVHLVDGDGRRGVLLIEVKLTEGGFTTCGGIDSRGNRDRAPCLDADLFFREPARCYLRHPYRATRDRRYWRIFEQAHGSLRAAFPGQAEHAGCPFAGDWQQPMRNHALALAMQQAGLVDFWHLALVHHDDNPDVPGPWDAYRRCAADAESLHRWPASSLLPALAACVPAADDHEGWMRARYVLDAEVE